MLSSPPLYVTNFNRNFTGVSATAAGVIRQHMSHMPLVLIGQPLPGCPAPVSLRAAYRMSRHAPGEVPFSIWHVRRNTEMRAALWARDVLRHPLRIVFTSAAQRRHSAFPRWLISRMDAVIATTPEAAAFVPNVCAVIPHGVDIKRFYPAPSREKAWAETGYGGKRGVATIGRIRPEKGTDQFVDAMIRLLPRHLDVTALIIGRAEARDAGFERALKARIAQAGLSERFVFTGELPADDLPELMRALSLLVALPRYEGYGMTPLEAMASGVPFVATDTGYFREFTARIDADLVVPLGEIDAAVARIDDLLSHAGTHEALSRLATRTASEHYSIKGEAQAISDIYARMWEA